MSTFLQLTITRDQWLEKIKNKSGSNGSVKVAKAVLKNAEDMCQDIYGHPLDETIAELERINDERAQVNFLQGFVDKLSKKGFKDIRLQSYLGYLRQYMRARGVKVSQDVRDEISIPVTEIEPRIGVEKSQIRDVLLQVKDTKYLTLILFLVSSACRIQEAMHIKVQDVQFLQEGIAQVNLKAKYVKGKKLPRTTFVSKECVPFLKKLCENKNPEDCIFNESDAQHWWNYPKKRPEILASIGADSNLKTLPFDNLPKKIQEKLRQAAKRPTPEHAANNAITWFWKFKRNHGFAKKYDTSNHDVFTFHSLRAYFETIVSDSFSHEAAHAFLGHRKYMMTYYRKSENQRKQDYLRFESLLHILDDGVNQKDVDVRDSRIRELETQLQAERKDYAEMMRQTRADTAHLKHMFEELAAKVSTTTKPEIHKQLRELISKVPEPAVRDLYTKGAKPY